LILSIFFIFCALNLEKAVVHEPHEKTRTDSNTYHY